LGLWAFRYRRAVSAITSLFALTAIANLKLSLKLQQCNCRLILLQASHDARGVCSIGAFGQLGLLGPWALRYRRAVSAISAITASFALTTITNL
jgi:hypothetical protein